MLLLLGILAFYLILAFVSVSLVWLAIGRKGFVGLEQTDSPFAKLFRARPRTILERPTETNSNNIPIGVTASGLATAGLAAMYSVSFGGAALRTVVERNSFGSPILRATGTALFQHVIQG